jgi:hypothetical protein
VYVDISSPEYRPNHNIEIVTRSFENVAMFRYLGMTVRNRNLIYEEIQSRLNSGSACNHSVKNLSSFRLVSIYTCIYILLKYTKL